MDEKLIILEMEETTESHIDAEDAEPIVEQMEETTDSHINADDIEPTVEQEEVIEYVEVEDVEEINIEINEAIGWVGGDPSKHYSLSGRDEADQHPIEAITGLRNELDLLGEVKDFYSAHGGYAEFRKWLDGGYYKDKLLSTGGVGYFVSLITDSYNNAYVDICNKKNADGTIDVNDIYGVTVASSGFYGYQNDSYNILDPTSADLSDNPNYAKVCLLGTVKVRVTSEDHLDINVGDYVVSNELGYAQKSENDVGFKVISKGQIESIGNTTTSWYYVEIALVPQNDNVARVMKKIEDTQVNLEGIKIQLGDVSNELEGVKDSNVQLGKDFEGLQDLVNESNKKIDTQLPEMEQKLQEAVDEVVSEANKTINDMTLEYAEAVSKANEAKETVGNVLTTVNQMKQELNPLAQWQEDGTSNIAGFVAQANEASTTLASITQAYGTDLTGIIQKIDENGAVIQHLVTHADKYTLGNVSPINGLSLNEVSFIQPGIIYVPIVNHKETYKYKQGEEEHTETIEFVSQSTDEQGNFLGYGNSYIWRAAENKPYDYMWSFYKNVYFSKPSEPLLDDLWYCWEGIIVNDKYIYAPGTLYRWDDTGDGLWVAVASVNDKSARAIGLINQTAEKLTSAYTDLEGNMSLIEQEVGEIRTIVDNIDSSTLSKIEQTAEDIMMGVYNPDGSSSLGLLLDGMTSMSNYGGRICVKHVLNTPIISGNRYSQSPMWDGEKFVFIEGALADDGIYYPYPDDDTKYCKVVSDGYEVYTIGNEATALLRTEVDENKSAIQGFTEFKTTTDTRITSVEQISDANSAKISSVAAGEYVVCSNINIELTESDLTQIPTIRYQNPPTWEDDGFVFDESDKAPNGKYCIFGNDAKHYYKLLFNEENNIVGYEQYELASTGSASIMQVVTKQGSSIGLLVNDDGVRGDILVETINGQSTATISADKIDLVSYAKLKDVEDSETEMKALISQTAEDIDLSVSKKLEDYSTTEEMNSAISVKADEITLSVSQKAEELADAAETDANKYTDNKIDTVNERMSSIEQDSSSIKLSVTEMGERFKDYSTTDEMNDAIDGVEANAQTYTDNQLVNYAKTSEITQLADKISLVVTETEDGNIIDVASIVTEINDGNSKISMKALDIDLTGYVTFNSLSEEGQTMINGSNITTGVIKSIDYSAPIDEDIFAQAGTKFDLSTGSINSKNFNIDANGNVDINGNITLDGSIVLNGSITWGTSNSFIKVLYAKSITQGKPTEDYDSYDEEYTSSTVWHKVYDEDYDRYASYSYDCGKTWEEPIKITGEDGDTIVNEVDYDTMYNMLQDSYGITSTEITGSSVKSASIQAPVITGGQIMGGEIIGGSFHAVDNLDFMSNLYEDSIANISTNASAYYIWKKVNENNKSLKGFIGFDSGINDPVFNYTADPAVYISTISNCNLKIMSSGNMSIGAGQIELSGNPATLTQDGTIYFMSNVVFNGSKTIDFADCEILNWNGPSGSNEAVFG